MNGMDAMTELSVFLASKLSITVFKNEKETGFSGEYVVVNCLPFSYGKAVNDYNALNVNIHIPNQKSGLKDLKRLNEVVKEIEALIPAQSSEEEEDMLNLNGNYYCRESESAPMNDDDDTSFINMVVSIIFNELKA